MPGNTRVRVLLLTLVLFEALIAASYSMAQDAAANLPPDAVFVSLSPPPYPVIARTAHIAGLVTLKIGVRQDGTVASAEMVSGPPLLERAAIQSATASRFECRSCSDEVTFYSLVYSFELVPTDDCSLPDGPPGDPGKGVRYSGNRVTVSDFVAPTCDPSGIVVAFKVRSAKCLYLWKCGRTTTK
jgi:Gram-negative bacterial TonB protein C-terminal